jgi:6-pyruvoyltetrahydropterin/6-carboxytetrahydropterin synthase
MVSAMEIFKEYTFEAAHRLPEVPDDHKCSRIHGHGYTVRLQIAGPASQDGWLMDFSRITEVFQPMLEKLDHSCLNDIEGLENPTCETICRWLWRKLKPELSELSQIVVQENPSSGCIYRGEDEAG